MAAVGVAGAIASPAADALRLGAQRDWLWELLGAGAGASEPWPQEQGEMTAVCFCSYTCVLVHSRGGGESCLGRGDCV